MNADEMVKEKFEIIVILEGTIESTGQSIQARSSNLPFEVLWGHRFEQLVSYRRETGEYRVDYSKFNSTQEVDTPMCSAKEYYDLQENIKNFNITKNFIELPSKNTICDEKKSSPNENGSVNFSTIIKGPTTSFIVSRQQSR